MVHYCAPRTDSDEHGPTIDLGEKNLLQPTIDALPAQIAILDDSGTIVALNRAWKAFSASPRSRMVCGAVGECYLAQCDEPLVSGIQLVLRGTQSEFSSEYQSDDPDTQSCYAVRVSVLDGAPQRLLMITHEDITRRSTAERALLEADQTLGSLVQSSPLPIIAFDTEGLVTSWNPAAERVFGWTAEEVLGTFYPIVPEGKREEFLANQDRILHGAGITGVELRRQRKDGSLLDVSVASSRLGIAGDRARGSMVVLTDISEQKRAQEEQEFLAEASDLLAGSLDYETTLTQVAQMAVPRLADICMVHLMDQNMTIRRLAIAHADPERQKLAQQLQDHGQLRMDDTWGVPVVLRTGSPVLYSEMPRAVWDIDAERPEHMAVIRALGMSSLMIVPLIARDQTIGTLAFVYSDSGRIYSDPDLGMATELARRAAIAIDNARLYREASEAERRYRTLVEQMPAVTYSTRADDLLSLTYISPQASHNGGLSPAEILSGPRHWMSKLHPDDVARVVESMKACSACGDPLFVEYRVLAMDGSEQWYVDQAQLIRDEEGTPLYWQGISVNITERKQAEEALGERVKELTVLHRAADLLQDEDCSISDILALLAEMLPQAMRYPDVAVACVSLGSMEYASAGFRDTGWSMRAEFSSESNVRGAIEVAYLEECWGEGEPFLPEELSLVTTITDMLNGYFQRIATQAELHRSEARFRAAAEGGLNAFFILEAVRSAEGVIVDYLIIDMNARGVEFARRPREQLLGQRLRDLWDPRVMRPFYEMFEHVSLTGEAVERELHMNLSANVNWLQCQVVPLADGVAVSVRDISDRKELEEQLTYQAFHDALTGLPNRELFLERVRHAHSRVRRRREGVAVLFMDLDNFKFVNDSLGHTFGDELLVAVARRISGCLGENASAARLGGDEFAILLEDLTDWAVATEMAEALVSAFRAPFTIASREIFISPSIGIALGSCREATAEDLLRDADAAMYRAKRNGRARYEVFEPSLTVHALQRLELENDLWRAVERGEFLLHYQPIVHLGSDETIGIEALVRWQHPLHGLIPPLDFIPIAEDTGLIVPLGRWVLEEACRQVSAWNRVRQGMPPLSLGVNLSRRQFYDPELRDHVSAALASSGLEPRLLSLEITESVMIEDESMASETLRGLKVLGIKLAIDDFGTGYSSLGMLRSFPVNVLKIDRGFIHRLEAGSDDLVIVSGIVSLAHALKLVVVAEGVETSQQLEHLKAIGCDFAQGYLVGKPSPAQPGGPPAQRLRAN